MRQLAKLTQQEHMYDDDVAGRYHIKTISFKLFFLISSGNTREKRTLKVLILVVIKFTITAKCNNGPCLSALQTKVKTKIQKIGNIKSFPCSVRSAGVLKKLTFDTTFLGFMPASN